MNVIDQSTTTWCWALLIAAAQSALSFPAAQARKAVLNSKMLGALRRRRSRLCQKVFLSKFAFL